MAPTTWAAWAGSCSWPTATTCTPDANPLGHLRQALPGVAVLGRPYRRELAQLRGVMATEAEPGGLRRVIELAEKPGPRAAQELDARSGVGNLLLVEGRARVDGEFVDFARFSRCQAGAEPRLSLFLGGVGSQAAGARSGHREPGGGSGRRGRLITDTEEAQGADGGPWPVADLRTVRAVLHRHRRAWDAFGDRDRAVDALLRPSGQPRRRSAGHRSPRCGTSPDASPN